MFRDCTLLLLFFVALGLSCEKSTTPAPAPAPTDLCQKAIDHLSSTLNGPGKMADGEKLISSVVTAISLARCRVEGLSSRQANCILSAKTLKQFMALGECGAIKEKKPSWLILPPTPSELGETQ